MHWSTQRALTTIAQQRHAQLDAALDEALHHDAHDRPRHIHAPHATLVDYRRPHARPPVHARHRQSNMDE